MLIEMQEPVAPRFIYVNPLTNKVHLLVPIVGGDEISTDNTCKATLALDEFFNGAAMEELLLYQRALEVDLLILEKEHAQWELKNARLFQIKKYIKAIHLLKPQYKRRLNELLKTPSNLYEIQLRPSAQDILSQVVNPVFSLNRKNNKQGVALSILYNMLQDTFLSKILFARIKSPKSILIESTFALTGQAPAFIDMQRILQEQFMDLFKLEVDFSRDARGEEVTQERIDALMFFNEETTALEYMDALLNSCVPDIWRSIPISLFKIFLEETSEEDKFEKLSILVQFFLANLNVFCIAQGLSKMNFGKVLDESSILSMELANVIATALNEDREVEKDIFSFFNRYQENFGLLRSLHDEETIEIQKKFERLYLTVTATKENPHMDDFKILDVSAIGEAAHFVSYKGYICVNFAKMFEIQPLERSFFSEIEEDFASHPAILPIKNDELAITVDLDIENLIGRITDEQFFLLPYAVKKECNKNPAFQQRQFLYDVAKGRQNEVKDILENTSDIQRQELLCISVFFKDYSGREFNCTAYEYAYWARDYRMCALLEHYMDFNTKAKMVNRIEAMERIDSVTEQKVGLSYVQYGRRHHSSHFDLSFLKTTLQRYIEGSKDWSYAKDFRRMQSAWQNIAKAQRELPAHFIQEYCKKKKSFEANGDLSRSFIFLNGEILLEWFPLKNKKSRSREQSQDLVLMRGERVMALGADLWGRDKLERWKYCELDLKKIISFERELDFYFDALRENLKPQEIESYCAFSS